jgi:hypothetical protein
LGLSSIPNSPVLDAELRCSGPFGFTPRKQILDGLSPDQVRGLLITIPTVSAHSKVSDVFEISRVRTLGS